MRARGGRIFCEEGAAMKKVVVALLILAIIGFVVFRDEFPLPNDSSSAARDPGVRGGAAGAGAPIAGLTRTELAFFNAGADALAAEAEASDGLRPAMHLGKCGGRPPPRALRRS